MGLPPGRGPIPVSGVDEHTDPELFKVAGELNAWIDYLLHPDTNDGPRIYRQRRVAGDNEPEEWEVARRSPYADPEEWETVSALHDYAADTYAFFRPAQAVSGISEAMIGETYSKLTRGYFTWVRPDGRTAKPEHVAARYQEMSATRDNWQQMRNGWVSMVANSAHEFEGDFIVFQLYTENGVYVVAEHLVRYRAIFKQASTAAAIWVVTCGKV